MIITTSWDDGHPLDMKLLELVEKYNLKATFYVPVSNPEYPVMSGKHIRELAQHQEVGGHTLNHAYLNRLDEQQAAFEITEGKMILEEITGQSLTAFCFPGGKFSARDIDLIRKAGFLFGRTTRLLSGIHPRLHLMDTTVQIYNHSSFTLLNHCFKHINLTSIQRNSFFVPFNKNFLKLAEHNLAQSNNTDDVFHIWGHSWEIAQYNVWKQLEDLFRLISSFQNVVHLNNTETWKAISSRVKFSFNDECTVVVNK